METIEIKYLGIPLIIHYKVDGKYYPATRYEPEEVPELDINEIYVFDSEIDIYNLFLEKQLDDIYGLVNKRLEI